MKYNNQLQRLERLGFKDLKLNCYVLGRVNGNADEVPLPFPSVSSLLFVLTILCFLLSRPQNI